jgi:hypothetical protein
MPNVTVQDGYFTVELDFGTNAFNGNGRWLDIGVRTNCNCFASYSLLSPRQPLTPAPYAQFSVNAAQAATATSATTANTATTAGSVAWANITGMPAGFADAIDNNTTYAAGPGLSLGGINNQFSVNFAGTGGANTAARSDHDHFGAIWGGNVSFGRGLSVTNAANNSSGLFGQQGTGSGFPYVFGNTAGVWGESSQGAGVWGASGAASGAGVRGIAMGNTGYGVYGYALATNGNTCGVYGESKSTYGNGVYGRQGGGSGSTPPLTYAGVWGDSADHLGVFGVSKNGTGVAGWSTATNGYGFGLSGEADGNFGTGVNGLAYSSTGKTKGVCGTAYSLYGAGVYGVAYDVPSNDDHNNYARGGVVGESSSSPGIVGISDWSPGVYGSSVVLDGVSGSSSSGAGVNASSESGVAVNAYSHTGVGILITAGGDIIKAFHPGYQAFLVNSNGDVHAHGAVYPNGADFAEMLPAQNSLEPGDVLVIGEDGKLASSTRPYQENVAGVHATKPGMVGGAYGADLTGKIPLAVVGVVPVKVTNENGPIKPGDKLTTSSTPGRAMKAGNHAQIGTAIGKALKPLNGESGTIDMLVILQ